MTQRRLELIYIYVYFGTGFRSHLRGSNLNIEEGMDKFVPKRRYLTTNFIPEEQICHFCDEIRESFHGPECAGLTVTVTAQQQISYLQNQFS